MIIYLSCFFMGIGFFSIFSSIIGVIKTRDHYNKIHFLSLADGFGMLCFCLGIVLSDFDFNNLKKIILFLIIYYLGSTTSGYILGNLIYKDKK